MDPNYEMRKFEILGVCYKNNLFENYNLPINSKISKLIILIERYFWWDRDGIHDIIDGYSKNKGYRNGIYLPLETIDDLLDQFNYVGFNDLCIYPPKKDMAFYKDPSSKHTKGIVAVYYGHTNENQTGKDKQNMIFEINI